MNYQAIRDKIADSELIDEIKLLGRSALRGLKSMARRKPYTKVKKKDQVRADHVKGMGDVVFKGFQCLNSECQEFIFMRMDELGEEFEFKCPECGFDFKSGEETQFYEYEIENFKVKPAKIIESGKFTILHDEYINEAQEYKYCIICNTIKPLKLFDRHKARKSGRQGECRLCKTVYNSIKNQTRITDQHREAAQKRRMYLDLAGGHKLDSAVVLKRFDEKCFKCGKDLKGVKSAKERPMDHTLPAYYLWPLTTDNATLLCRGCNGEKSGKWPSKYYSDPEIKKLSMITGLDYDILAGDPHFNPDAISKLKDRSVVDSLLSKYARYIDEIIKLRNRILSKTDFDFFKTSPSISPRWIRRADRALGRTPSEEQDTDEK